MQTPDCNFAIALCISFDATLARTKISVDDLFGVRLPEEPLIGLRIYLVPTDSSYMH